MGSSENNMLERTFLHAPGIGRVTEQALWSVGATTWESYLDRSGSWPVTDSQNSSLVRTLQESRERLAEGDYAWFARLLPAQEHWRAVPEFGYQLGFLDIETNGGQNADDITVIGLYDGRKMQQFVAGVNLHRFPEAVAECALLVTFFGTVFDIPFIKRAFPGIQLPQLHVDLCYLFRRVGRKGGLKSIERQLGIVRSSAADGLNGMDAVRLWQEYRLGRKHSLDLLLNYNAEDVKNMAELLQIGYQLMRRHTLAGGA